MSYAYRLRETLPKPSYAETVEQLLVTEEDETFDLGLCDEHLVEGIRVLSRHQSCPPRMLEGYRQGIEVFARYPGTEHDNVLRMDIANQRVCNCSIALEAIEPPRH